MQQETYRPPEARRDPLVRQFFIVPSDDGNPGRAGQIKTVTSAGDYVCAVWLGTAVSHAVTVSPETLTSEKWMLFQNESSWRAAYTKLSSTRPADAGRSSTCPNTTTIQ
jgi:hypothetical protein